MTPAGLVRRCLRPCRASSGPSAAPPGRLHQDQGSRLGLPGPGVR